MTEESFLSMKGRISSRDYFARGFAMIGLIIMFLYVANSESLSIKIFSYAIVLISYCTLAIQTIKRLYDIGRIGEWALILLIPFLNIIFCLYLMFKTGQKGSNQYGKNPFAI
jgi:uncharacterized membrane protein YhaH (DUF805 family)